MARKKLDTTAVEQNEKKTKVSQQSQLSLLVGSYGKNKDEFNELKKECDTQNAAIKELMVALDCSEYESGGYIAKYSVSHSETLNEDKLLDLFQKECYDKCIELGIIKTREYIDDKALEAAIYNEQISKKIILKMDKCKESKDTPKLNIYKVKEKK